MAPEALGFSRPPRMILPRPDGGGARYLSTKVLAFFHAFHRRTPGRSKRRNGTDKNRGRMRGGGVD